MRLSLVLIFVFAARLALAQPSIDCGSDEAFRGLRLGQQLVVPCDSMVLVTKPTYERLTIEAEQLRQVVELSEERNQALADMLASQQSIISVQRQEIAALDEHDQTLRSIADRLEQDLETSIENTSAAVAIARRNRVLGILLGGTAGLAVGVVVGGIFF